MRAIKAATRKQPRQREFVPGAVWAVGAAAGAGGRGRGGGEFGVEPAGMHPRIERLGGLGIDVPLPHDAAEGRLHMPAGAPEPVVKLKMAERRIQVVAPQQAHHALAEPHAFGVGGRTLQGLTGFCRPVGARLLFLSGRVRLAGRRFGWVGRLIAALPRRPNRGEKEDERCAGRERGGSQTGDRHVSAAVDDDRKS